MKKRKKKFKLPPVGTAHFLRNGAGPHKDRKKEAKRMACRKKDDTDA